MAMSWAFYLERAERYGIMAPAAASEARDFLNSLEDGYGIRFTRSGLIFDLASLGRGSCRFRIRHRVLPHST